VPHEPKNLAASVRQRLLDLARSRNEDFGLILVKYGLKRILYRLSRSKHRDTFVLKGALLFELWTKHTYRATRDADFLARGDNSPERFVGIFKELWVIEVEPDGVSFDADSVKAERITEDADYEGVRVTFTAHLERARIPIQIDIGFGDAITPAPVETQYPTLLPAPNPRLLTYPKETVVAEKFEAMVKLGIADAIRRMPNQLFLQAFLVIELVLKIIEESTLYYVQRLPEELGDIAWTIDRKNRTITEMEETWSTVILPMSESHFAQNPLITLREAVYTPFDARYGIDPNDDKMRRHIKWTREAYGVRDTDRPPGLNPGLLLGEQRELADSA
jgi:hypothetical protein